MEPLSKSPDMSLTQQPLFITHRSRWIGETFRFKLISGLLCLRRLNLQTRVKLKSYNINSFTVRGGARKHFHLKSGRFWMEFGVRRHKLRSMAKVRLSGLAGGRRVSGRFVVSEPQREAVRFYSEYTSLQVCCNLPVNTHTQCRITEVP